MHDTINILPIYHAAIASAWATNEFKLMITYSPCFGHRFIRGVK